jgi:hypothetical protein
VHGDEIESLLYWNIFVYNGHIIKKRSAGNTSPCSSYRQGGGCQCGLFVRTTLLLATARGGFPVF